jgi:glyoxylase-like metal-dependent hydrolase (beta-lactamase superfamily II)
LDNRDAAMLDSLRKAGKLALVDGDAKEIVPGITVYTGGKHTYASQAVAVRTAEGVVVLASDNIYLYENIDSRRPIAQTLDSISNLATQVRLKGIASDPRLVVPGHDPSVLDRFPVVAPGAVRITLRKGTDK